MPVPVKVYTLVNPGTDEVDIDKRSETLNKVNLIGATISKVYFHGIGRNETSTVVMTLMDGRTMHIHPRHDGKALEFSIFENPLIMLKVL